MRRRITNSNPPPIFAWLLFFVWPFGMFLIAIWNFSNKVYRLFILLYFVFFGYTFVIKGELLDSAKHKLAFEDAAKKPAIEVFNIVNDYLSLKGEDLDIYLPLANYMVSRFTSDAGFVFAFHALIFGFFYLKSINFVFDEFNGKYNKNAVLFILMFVTLFSIYQINGVRYFTAFWIWTFGALKLLSLKKPKYVLICLSASLVHFGITPATLVIIIFYLLGPRNKVYIPILIVSFIVGNFFQLDSLVEIGAKINDAAEKRASLYSNLDVVATRSEDIKQSSWFILLRPVLLHYYLLFALGFIYLRRKKFIWDRKQEYLLSFLILFLSFVNFVLQVPSFGGRMRFVFWVMTAYFLYRFFQINKLKTLNNIMLLGIAPILLWTVVELRMASEVTNIIAVIGNPFFTLFDKSNISVYDALTR